MAEKPAFNFSSMDWDAYVKFRPVYPQELYSTIYAYHDSHGGAYDSAVDVGAGVGVVSVELVKKFSHVTVTDPAESYVSAARKLFEAYPQEQIGFLATKAEDISLEKLQTDKKVDLVTAAECLHWADLDVATPKIASVLKSGGTFAAWLYGVRPIIEEQQSENLVEARKIFYEIYEKMIVQYDSQIEKQDEASGGAAMNARLDHMPFPSDAWTNIRRLHTRTDSAMAHPDWPSRKSQVSSGDKIEKLPNEQLLNHNADYEYLEGYLVNWIPPIKVKEFAATELARLQKAMNGQKINVTWPFVLVLATRK